MAVYKVVSVQTVYEVTYVEANSAEHAEDIVLDDGGTLEWSYYDSSDWQISSTEEN